MSIMPKRTINGIFDVRQEPAVPDGMNILHEVTRMDEAREQLLCDTDGHCHLAAEPAKDGHENRLGMATYVFDRRIVMPVSRESALSWSHYNLCGDELMAAMKEFGEYATDHQIVWEYSGAAATGQDGIHEWLMESSARDFVLYSTDYSYPFCNGSTTFVHSAEDGTEQFAGEVYVYYIPAETARRWAETRGMDADTCAEVFG